MSSMKSIYIRYGIEAGLPDIHSYILQLRCILQLRKDDFGNIRSTTKPQASAALSAL